jgi:membrane-bound lytic murein transglycosylase B
MKKNIFVILFLFIFLPAGFFPLRVLADETASTQAQLQQQLLQIQQQIAQFQQQLKDTQSQKNTLANKIKSLQKQQSVLNLQIQETNLKVTDLGSKITVTESFIDKNNQKVQSLQNEIASLIRTVNQNDNYPFLYTVVSRQKLSDVFNDYEGYAQISRGLETVIAQIKNTNVQLSDQHTQLEGQQTEAQNLLSIKVLQQGQLVGSVGQQNSLLQETKGKEADYQIVLNDSKKQAAEIAGRIYQLLGISGQITFGEALKIAQWAQGATGIDPAFLLAVLTQESNLGQNVGTCNRAGDPASKSYKVVMKPDRDIQPFLDITSSLGLDPDITPVSCAAHDKSGKRYGWGGAMGPAQFIPSTWMGYKDKVAAINGKGIANPWDIRDAFAAAAIKLVAGGADNTRQGQWDAAMRYFSGSTNSIYRFYGDSVIALTSKYQSDINNLGK